MTTRTLGHAQAHARYLGADAAVTAATLVEMTEADAHAILRKTDPAVLNSRYAELNLSGLGPYPPTVGSIAKQAGANDGDIAFYGDELLTPIADAWNEGYDAVWTSALQAAALRVVGEIDVACDVERDLARIVDGLRNGRDIPACEHPRREEPSC